MSLGKHPRQTPTFPGAIHSDGYHPNGPSQVPKRPRGALPTSYSNNLFSIPIQQHNSVIHQQTNNTSSIPVFVKPWKGNWEKNYKHGYPLFVKSGTGSNKQQTVGDIATVNWDLRHNEASDEDYHEWNFMGVFRNELGGDQPFGKRKYNQLQRLFNIDVMGRSKISNIFGKKVKTGDHVALALVRMQVPSTYCKDPFDKNDNCDLAKYYHQIRPLVNGTVPDLYNMATETEIIRKFNIGIVSSNVARKEDNLQTAISMYGDNMNTLPKIEVLIM